MATREKYLEFNVSSENTVTFSNSEEDIGHLERVRVGAWMSWVIFLELGCYLSGGCADEVRRVQKFLNHSAKKGTSQFNAEEWERLNGY